jgi:hypothetical protein
LIRYASLQKALELSPDFAPALHELCALQFLDGKFSDSEATASSLLALRPSQGGFPAIFGSRVTMLQPLFAEHLAWLLLPRDYAESFTLRGQARIALKKYDTAWRWLSSPAFCNAFTVTMALLQISATRFRRAWPIPKYTTCVRCATAALKSLCPIQPGTNRFCQLYSWILCLQVRAGGN